MQVIGSQSMVLKDSIEAFVKETGFGVAWSTVQ
jgi:hypothetical protein